MKSRFSLGRLAATCARNPWRVVSAWGVIFLAAMVVAAAGLTGVLNNDLKLVGNFDSVVGSRLLNESSLNNSVGFTETIIIRSTDGTTIDDPVFREKTDAVVAAVRAEQGSWTDAGPTAAPDLMALASDSVQGSYVLDYFEIQDALGSPAVKLAAENMGATEQIDALVSADRTILLVPVTIADAHVDLAHYIEVVNGMGDGQFHVTTIGNLSINEEYQRVVAEELVTAETIGLPIAIVVLLLVFGSFVAPVVPLVLGVMSVGIALGIVTLIGQVVELQLFVQNMVTMLGLAIGIDYSLFMVERFREQRGRGFSKQRSIEIAGATSGKAVVFSGITLILAMLGVMLVRINIFFSLAVGAIVVVSCAVILSATLVPALLSLVGDHIDWPRKKPLHHE